MTSSSYNTRIILFFLLLVCREDHKPLTELSGQLSSLDDGFCTWLITLPKDLRIILYFKSYNIDVTGNNLICGSQGTRIELKDSFEDQPWKTYCQSKMPQPVATNKSSLLVNFILSESDDKSWFTANYTTLPFEKSKYISKYEWLKLCYTELLVFVPHDQWSGLKCWQKLIGAGESPLFPVCSSYLNFNAVEDWGHKSLLWAVF